jgi:hypothetical protein
MARHRIYFKGGFPQVRTVVNLVNRSLPMARSNIKNASVMHSPTCCLVLCKSVWMIDCLSFFVVPSRSSSTPLYPQSAISQGPSPQLRTLSLFSLQIHIWVYEGTWEHVTLFLHDFKVTLLSHMFVQTNAPSFFFYKFYIHERWLNANLFVVKVTFRLGIWKTHNSPTYFFGSKWKISKFSNNDN